MSMHKVPLTPLEEEGLRKHHLPIGTPSQLSDCFRLGVAAGLASASSFDAVQARAQIAVLEKLSVTNIMLDIQPGLEGEGVEIYAKSVADVEDKLSKMGQELEEWQLGIKKLPVFEGVANTKAKGLENRGFVPYGQLFQQRLEDGSFKFAAVSKAGRVLWWNPAQAGTPQKIPTPPGTAEITDICYAEGWNQCCDAFFGGHPAPEPVVITVEKEPAGKVTLTKTPDGELVAVTRQDDEGRILSVIWEREPKV